MMIVPTLFKQRRRILLCAVTLALHWLLISWLGAYSRVDAGAVMAQPGNTAAPVVISAELHRTPSAPPVSAGSPVLQKAGSPKPVVVRRLPAQTQSAHSASSADSSSVSSSVSTLPDAPAVADDNADIAASTADATADPAAPPSATADHASTGSGPDTNSDAGRASATPAKVASPAPAPASTSIPTPISSLPRYKVKLPPSAEFVLDVRRVDANGTTWSGVAAMSWDQHDGKYKMSLEAGLNMLITRVNLLVLTSEGEIDENGIAPIKATEKRRGRSLTATHFERAQGRITFSASEQTYPLLIGTQDKATLPFQLAGIGRADLKQLQGDIDVFVGEEAEANVFRFKLVGEDELDTKLGRLRTWHLSRPPKPGTYSSQLDIWLAPERSWYPVQIRNTESSGAVTTQSVTKITLPEVSRN